jgi:hypothetical protein
MVFKNIMSDQIDWKPFVPTSAEMMGRVPLEPGDVFASWTSAGSVRKLLIPASAGFLAGFPAGWDSNYTRLIRHADGRWARDAHPAGWCQKWCGQRYYDTTVPVSWKGSTPKLLRVPVRGGGEQTLAFCTEFCWKRAEEQMQEQMNSPVITYVAPGPLPPEGEPVAPSPAPVVIPADYRLAPGWRLAPPETFYCGPCAGTFSRQTWAMFVSDDFVCCVACSLSMGALEPIPAATPEPAPPAGVPVCKAWCGQPWGNEAVPACFDRRTGESGLGSIGEPWGVRQCGFDEPAYCTEACWRLGKPLNPPPSAPVEPGEHVVHMAVDATKGAAPENVVICVSPASAPVTVDCSGASSCDGCDYCVTPAEKVAGRPFHAGLSVTVATGGVPAGYRLGRGWTTSPPPRWSCTRALKCGGWALYAHLNDPRDVRSGGPGACADHAVEMGALVPIDTALSVLGFPQQFAAFVTDNVAQAKANDTARSVPPGPVPVEAPRGCQEFPPCEEGTCRCRPIRPPAAPASEPAVRPLSERMRAWVTPEKVPSLLRRQELQSFFDSVATLEAELAEVKREYQLQLACVTEWTGAFARVQGESDAARAEVERWNSALADEMQKVEQLRGKLGSVSNEVLRLTNVVAHQGMEVADAKAEATARVRSMREAAEGAGYLEATKHHDTLLEKGQAVAARIRALPLDTGTVADTGGEAASPAKVAEEFWERWKLVMSQRPLVLSAVAELVAAERRAQAEAIKAAVEKALRKAARDVYRFCLRGENAGQVSTPHGRALSATVIAGVVLRSGEDAPGAVG